MDWLYFIIAGVLAGFIAGIGMGGGTLLIPVLTLLCKLSQHSAQGVNMLSFIPAAVIALIIHKKAGRLSIKSALPIIAGGIAGAVAGALIANIIDGAILRRGFGAFLLILGVVRLVRTFHKSNGGDNAGKPE